MKTKSLQVGLTGNFQMCQKLGLQKTEKIYEYFFSQMKYCGLGLQIMQRLSTKAKDLFYDVHTMHTSYTVVAVVTLLAAIETSVVLAILLAYAAVRSLFRFINRHRLSYSSKSQCGTGLLEVGRFCCLFWKWLF